MGESIVPAGFEGFTNAVNSPYMTMEEFTGGESQAEKHQISTVPERVVGTAKMGLEFIPFAKYLLPENRDEYEKLSEEDKSSAILWETFGAAAFIIPLPLPKLGIIDDAIRAGGKEGGFMSKVMRKMYRKADPIEDIGEWKVKHYRPAVVSSLEKQGFKKAEIDAIVDDIHGAIGALDQYKVNAAWKKEGFSEAWQKGIVNTGKPYGKLALGDDLANSLKPKNVRRKTIETKYHAAAQKELGSTANTEAAFKSYFKKEFGYKKSLGDATEAEISMLSKDMLSDTGRFSKVTKIHHVDYVKPARVTFGTGEAVYGTFTNIYRPIKDAILAANEHTLSNIRVYRKMLEQRGLGKIKKGEGTLVRGFKPINELTPEVRNRTAKEMRWIDDVMGEAQQGKISVEHARELAEDRLRALRKHDPHVAALADATYDYFDHLYGQRMLWKLQDLFDKAPMTRWGRVAVEQKLEQLAPAIREAFSTTAKKSMTEKLGFIDETLNTFKQFVDGQGNVAFRKIPDGFKRELTRGKNGKWMPYHEYYTPRVAEIPHRELASVFEQISGKQVPFYAKPRTSAEMLGKPKSFEEMIYSRTRAQSKEMFVYSSLKDVGRFAQNLPQTWKDYTEHYIARVLSIPSPVDAKVANVLNRSPMVNSLAKAFGRDEAWDAYRVQRLGRTVIDFTYLGYLGFKPFSAMRNLFQPLITVPADLGGLKNFSSLAKGYARLKDPATKSYLDSIGIITNYAPGITMSENLIGLGSRTIKGIGVPQRDTIRDYAMWMFRGSDMINRYVTGGAAMHRWETALKKIPQPAGNPRTFMKISGVNGRHEWVRHEIEGHIAAGRLSKAKEAFVKDVVADTQYLYGAVDAPVAAQVGGVFGRTASVFQSWWANYGTLLQKWHTTGELPQAGSRMLPWMGASAIAYTLMEPMWGSFVASKSTGIGPLPLVGGIQEAALTGNPRAAIPDVTPMGIAKQIPGWLPIAESLHMAMTAGSILIAGEWESPANQKRIEDRAKAMVKSFTSIAIPGGSQLNRTVGATMDDGFPGFAKSVISMRQ